MRTYIIPYPYAPLHFIKIRLTVNRLGKCCVEPMMKYRMSEAMAFDLAVFADKFARENACKSASQI